MYLLHIETATSVASVALSEDGSLVDLVENEGVNIHASVITTLILKVLSQNSLSMNELAAISLSCGPGSYTGLRIGAATAKGLCYALDIPLIAVNTLVAMCCSIKTGQAAITPGLKPDTLLVPMIDARRMEVYTAVYSLTGEIFRPTEALILTESSFINELSKHPVLFFGTGAAKAVELYSGPVHGEFTSFDLTFKNSAAGSVAPAWERYKGSQFESLTGFEPFYLKDFMPGPGPGKNKS